MYAYFSMYNTSRPQFLLFGVLLVFFCSKGRNNNIDDGQREGNTKHLQHYPFVCVRWLLNKLYVQIRCLEYYTLKSI